MKQQKSVSAFLFLLLFSCTNSFAQNYYKDACNQYYNGNDDKISVELFTKAIEHNEELAKSYMLRGASKTYLNDFFGAATDIDKSIKLDPSDYKAYFYRGRLYFVQGFFKNAIAQYDLAISKNALDADSYDERATAKIKEEDYLNAIKDEDAAIKINPKNADFFNNRGYAKLQLKLYKEAIADFDKALEIGDTPRSYANKGLAWAGLGDLNKAIEFLTIAIGKMPKASDVLYQRGLSYKSLKKGSLACEDFSKSAEMGYEPAVKEKKLNCK